MTDTGQVPGEGLPENAGMVEQPGVTTPGAYTFLDPSESPVEDDDLLLMPGAPGAQGAWGNEVPPPAPMPFTDEPGPHETDGRDSGAIDLAVVRAPGPVPAPQPVPPRRPLHLGPPTPDGSSSPVRSLADRGPAGSRTGSMAAPVTPLRHAGPPTVGPEYLDVPQPAEALPQGGVPWGTPPVEDEAKAAETVVPEAAHMPGSGVSAEAGPLPEVPQAAEPEQAPGFVAAPFVHDPAPAPDAVQPPVPGADEVSLPLQSQADGQAPEAEPVTDGSPAPQVPDAPQFPDADPHAFDTPDATDIGDVADVAGQAAVEAETSAHEAAQVQIPEDAGHIVPVQHLAPAEEGLADAQVPPQPAGQDVYGVDAEPGAQVAGFADSGVHMPEPAVQFADEAALPGTEQSVGAAAPHAFEVPESALSALSARSAEASQGGQDLGLEEFQQFNDQPAFSEDGSAVSEEAAFSHNGVALSGHSTTEAPHGVPVGVAAHTDTAHPTEGHSHGDQHYPVHGDQHYASALDTAGAPGFPGAPLVPQADQSLGHQFVPVDAVVPTAPHLAPTPPHAMTVPPLPVEEQPPAQEPAPAAAVLAPAPVEEAPGAAAEPVAQAPVPAPGKRRPSPYRNRSPRSRNP